MTAAAAGTDRAFWDGIATLLDWKRRVFELYAAVRHDDDPSRTWERWRATRDELFASHPQSPIPWDERAAFSGLAYFDHDPSYRVAGAIELAEPVRFHVTTSGGEPDGTYAFTRFATVAFELHGAPMSLDAFWLDAYGGGMFVPFRDRTSGDATYSAGRYLLDTVKGSDLGTDGHGRLMLDFNFAYNPSCAYDPRWVCPLAPPGNRLDVEVRAGERHPRGGIGVTVVVTGTELTADEVVRVARHDEPVELAAAATERMRVARDVVDRALASGVAVYGLSTGLGVLKRDRVPVEADALSDFNRRLIGMHRTGQGPDVPRDVVRATMLRLANHFALGTPGVRPELADLVVRALNRGATPRVRALGSVGQSDLMLMADLAHGLLLEVGDGFALAAGEALALLNNNALSTGWAALVLADAANLTAALETAGALSLEGFGANLTMLHPAIGDLRPYPGVRSALERIRNLMHGSSLWEPDAARNLQDPLTFRNLPLIQGAVRDALAFAGAQEAIELNASQGNPIVVAGEDRVISVANFEIVPLAAALDLVRIAMAPALTASGERIVKLLETPWSGLPTGLAARSGAADAGLGYLGIAAQSIVAEARLLAQPVSFEMASSAHAEGIEDRATMAPLSARRVAEMIALGERVAAIELVVAAQAADLRGTEVGRGTGSARGAVRERTPFTGAGELVQQDLQPVVDLVIEGAFSRPLAG